ncbi:MAG: hypothetical protein EAZ62_00065 [Sphingobacteriia bacterium]|nr:MAG: hypothetical protein EAZ62_00065 [Sphingobacteriia bacterium]
MNTSQQTTPKDNRKLIYGLLVAALLGTWAYIFYDKSQNKETITLLETRIKDTDSARTALQAEFALVSSKADSLSNSNLSLQGELAEKNTAIQQLRGNIAGILKKKNATAKELAEAKKMIGELNGKIDGLFVQIEQLKSENSQLTTANTQLTEEKTQLSADKQNLEQNLTNTKTENKQLADKVDVASTLHASNIGITAINIKNSGKQTETSKANRADLIRISFNIDENRITPSGTKDFYVVVSSPDGKIVTEGGSFATREEGTRTYTSKVSVNYEQNKNIPVSFDWKQTERFKDGDYKIEIYNNGFKIGQGTKTLRKSGLF